ncbi:hypothetical protein AAFN60_06885 [Roseibacillus persicicus]|uniref:hypothetical protein n=1 Tax=Roseibacillus persicicus TaxID=454148 RepID=UPI00398A907F
MTSFNTLSKLTAISCFFLALPKVEAEVSALSEGDRQALMERLKELQEGAGGRAEKRAGSALAAFRAAAGSDDKAHEFYLSCVEKVRFQDEKKSAQDFRDWKRRHKDREDSDGFRRVLRHQLNWLLLTIDAANAKEGSESELSTRAVTALDAILGDPVLEGPQFGALEQDVTKTVFALAYGLRGEGKWPVSPMKLEDVYKKHILPPLAEKKDVAAYRNAWRKWMSQEAKLQEVRAAAPDKGERSAAYERFLVEKRPQMLWDLEKAIFEMGDQKGAALAMLSHLEAHAGHKNEIQWTKDFAAYLEPKPSE